MAGQLDTWVAPIEVLDIISGVLVTNGNAQDESDIAAMRGLVGRAAANLNQLP